MSRESSWKISNEQLQAQVVIVMGTRHGTAHFSAKEPGDAPAQSASDIELSELVQMQGFVGVTSADHLGTSTMGQFVVMCEEEQMEKYQSFLKTGLPLESTIELESPIYLDSVLKELSSVDAGKKGKGTSRSEAMKCLAGTLLFERIRVNPLYYDIDTRHGRGSAGGSSVEGDKNEQQVGWAESAVVDRWIERLVELSCLKALGLETVELTEIGSRLLEAKLSVELLDRLRRYLKENSRKAIQGKVIEKLTLSSDATLLTTRTKEFYSKLPRALKDQNAWFPQETNSPETAPTGEAQGDTETNIRSVKELLLACFEAGRIPFNDPLLAQEQARLVIQSIKILFQ